MSASIVWLLYVPPVAGRSESAGRERMVYVSVTDGKGGLVTDLTAADVAIKEGGKDREVIKVEPFTGPVHLALLVEEGLTGDNNVRNGLFQFMRQVHNRADIALVVVSIRNMMIVDYTKDLNALLAGINRFSLNPFVQAENLAEGVYEVAHDFRKGEAARRVIVALAVERDQGVNMQPDQVLDELRQSGAALYAVTLPGPRIAVKVGQMADLSARGQVLGDGTSQSGGRRQEVTITAGIPKVLEQFAGEILHEYAVTYVLPDGVKPNSRISLSTKRRGLSVRAPSRVPDR